MSDSNLAAVPNVVSETKRGRGRPRKHSMLYNESWLREQYVVNGLTLSQIAKEVGCTPVNVAYVMREKFGIERRPVGTRASK